MYILDARGLACPQPVILVRQQMLQRDEMQVLVSSQDAVNNISRLAEKSGWTVEASQTADGYALILHKGNAVIEPVTIPEPESSCAVSDRTVVLCASSELGRGIAELGDI